MSSIVINAKVIGLKRKMYGTISSLALVGIEAKPIQIQVQISPGLASFAIVGLADKSVHESQSRIKAALTSLGLALPPKRITINLQPANQPKEGSHYDLPIALGLMVAMGVIPSDSLSGYVCLGELGLDGYLASVSGVLPAAVMAKADHKGLICPEANGSEARWVEGLEILAPAHLLQVVGCLKGQQSLDVPLRPTAAESESFPDMRDVQGQTIARRALEVAAVGGHNMLMIGPPGAGKSMLAQRLAGILPPLSPEEALEVSMIQSVAGQLPDGVVSRVRPFRDPHHSTSMPAMIGGGAKAKPGEVSMAHCGVLFLDELPEFSRQVLESLRQPIETATVSVARVNAHITYPARFQLIAAMNPCRCGAAMDMEHYCAKFPRCAQDYQGKISGPLMDRLDIHLPVPKMTMREMLDKKPAEDSATVRARVLEARAFQRERMGDTALISDNAHLAAHDLEKTVGLTTEAKEMLIKISEKMQFSARGYHRTLRLARSIADLAVSDTVTKTHIAEALNYRRVAPKTR